MDKLEFSTIEKQMANYDFVALQNEVDTAKTKIATAKSAADVKTEICNIWGKIKPFVKALTVLPIVGKFIAILADLLDAFCK